MTLTAKRVRWGAVAMALAGVLFVFYEAVAPRTDQTTLEGAASWASDRWAAAHVAAMVGLILIPLTWRSLRELVAATPLERPAFRAVSLGFVGSALTISYYGAETYGLKAIGERAVADGDATLTAVGEGFRMEPVALTIFAVGLALIAVAAVVAAVVIWRSDRLNRWSGLPLAVAMATYLPHFFLPHPARIAWGVLVAIGALWIAAELWRAATAPEATS